jgi:hypothetical protein
VKATTALITINGHPVLQVLLIPENEQERLFLEDALAKAEDFKLSAAAYYASCPEFDE